MRNAARADENQRAIVGALRKAGYVVWHIKWPVDLLVRCKRAWLPIEVKNDARGWELTEDQRQFVTLAGDAPVAVVTDAAGALRACAVVDRGGDWAEVCGVQLVDTNKGGTRESGT